MAYDELRGEGLATQYEDFLEPSQYFTDMYVPNPNAEEVAVPGAGYNMSVPWTQCGSSDHKARLALFERHIKASPKALAAVVTLTCPESVYAAQGLLANLENPIILMLQLRGNATNDTRLSSASTKEDTIDRFLFGKPTKETKDPNAEVAAVLKGGTNVATSVSISSTLEKFSSLRVLGLSGVHLREGTVAWLPKLDQLYYLVLSGAGITALPTQGAELLTNLIYLAFSDNHLTSVPAVWGAMSNKLHYLSYGGNALTEFNLISTATMQRLDLRANRLAQMPAGLGELITLEVIDLSHNRITHFPASLGESCRTNAAVQEKLNDVNEKTEYSGWQTLHLQHNLIEQLPSSFSLCVDLLYLDLGDNLLTHLPDDLFSGDPSYVPSDGSRGSKLMYLRVDGNKLTTFGTLFEQKQSSTNGADLIDLISLRASRNRLTAIPLSLLLNVPNLKYVEERVAR